MLASLLRIARIVAGVVLVIIGLLALITPLTPGAWLAVVGLELLGLRVAFATRYERARTWLLAWWQARRRRGGEEGGTVL